MREKLIELLYHSGDECDQLCRTPQKGCHVCKYADCGAKCINVMEADYLIANGVTIREKATWGMRMDNSGWFNYYACSLCGTNLADDDWNFCPNCGADMRPDAPKDGE